MLMNIGNNPLLQKIYKKFNNTYSFWYHIILWDLQLVYWNLKLFMLDFFYQRQSQILEHCVINQTLFLSKALLNDYYQSNLYSLYFHDPIK
jgi:hypothetical protein